MNIVLGVGGGIAAYKSALLLRLFTEAGHKVTVIPTEASKRFVGVATWEALSGRPATNDVFDAVESVNHVRIGQEADLIVVAPATADLLAKAAGGHANDLLTTTLLMARGPVLFAPAMHTEMWQHAATAANVATLRARGIHVLDPAVGRLTGADTGPGRLPEPEEIFAAAMALVPAAGPALGEPAVLDPDALEPGALEPGTDRQDMLQHDAGIPAAAVAPELPADTAPAPSVGPGPDAVAAPAAALSLAPAGGTGPLSGRQVLITAGGTREPLDPVRYLGNKSSGKQGVALAEAALAAGATVTLIHAPLDVPVPAGVKLQPIETARELRAAALAAAATADVVVMAAAVADFRPASLSTGKIKKRDNVPDPVIELVRNPDILVELVAHRAAQNQRQLIVGFAAETGDEQGDAHSYGRQKLVRKGCDLLVVNEVGPGESGAERVFGQDNNQVEILALDGASPVQTGGSKREVADAVVHLIAQRLANG
ncbi:bifunctional phosphopantothenoylcysteine decarboxylase/phosphopantothenate synthase [Arthrobacter sp. H35-D1]|uniref:bifunctional phosphopantothenoylcysteine decarboxylase/phosphopantothenate synthase n=1 Tax=Arthrobacter sp. H35-D1 TaxID=3046202 RepID=UPI0024BA53C1|nr:bifunctional phosphopantothenoylcysteine decarboxylase/phosphopantothenate synthase [Arthrobacter sp. H35-D1]MDJ0313385.1 bifunctional phosphopantothenoylcysteine decarboxylase/phosphopantothenate synthase [Arthrobacter sp. H35-D1]